MKKIAFCRKGGIYFEILGFVLSRFRNSRYSPNPFATLDKICTLCHTGSIHESASAFKQMSGEIDSLRRLIVQQKSANSNLHMILQHIFAIWKDLEGCECLQKTSKKHGRVAIVMVSK